MQAALRSRFAGLGRSLRARPSVPHLFRGARPAKCSEASTASATTAWSQRRPRRQHRARPRDARSSIDPYGWFTEGFDTPDLKEAKALLDALSS